MEKMLDDLKQLVSSMPIPNESSVGGHIESHNKIIQTFHFFIDLVSSYHKGTESEIKELNNRLSYLGDCLLQSTEILNKQSKIIKSLERKRDIVFTDLNQKQDKSRGETKIITKNGIVTKSGSIINQSINSFTYKIHNLKFNNSQNYYFQESIVDGKNVLKIFFEKTSKAGAIEYTVFISTSD